MCPLFILTLLGFLTAVNCVNFPFESIQLSDADVANFSAIAFGNKSTVNSVYNGPSCKAFPGTTDWPVDDEWNQLNSSLGGALLKPAPAASVCYNGSLYNSNQCNFLITDTIDNRFYLDDPLTVLTTWPEGDTCQATLNPRGNCTQGGFPVYVVNVTSVKQIQTAVNFARNKNLRLVIKNTGHDFCGRSTGAGSLSIWTHHLKNFEFLPQYSQGEYSGMGARVGAGLEAWELYHYMDLYNMTIVVPGGSTVGAYGGWMAGGGHSTLGSLYGLGSDQPLTLQVVTADGRFITADPDTNVDLYYALRGGGPGTYGIVTSAVVKAYPAIHVAESTLNFLGGSFSFPSTFNFSIPSNFTFPTNLTVPSNFTIPSNFTFTPPVIVEDIETFWSAVNKYYYFGKYLCDAGGTAYSYVSKIGNNSFSFTTTFEMPGMSTKEAFDFVQPLFDSLNKIGIPVNNTEPITSLSWGATRQGEGDSPGDARFASRLFPRSNWENDTLFEETMTAIRETIEAGYTFHGIHISPTEKTAGYPGNSSVNPAFRKAVMHADTFDMSRMILSKPQQMIDEHTIFNSYVDKLRAVTPGAGAYINEADVQEPNWQQSFFGDKYAGLLEIKKNRDPWGLFWAPTTVGSENWEVQTADGLPTQNGKLCRVEKSS